MTSDPGADANLDARQRLLAKVVAFARRSAVTDKSLREIAAGAGTSHRMLLYHFGSREGLLAAIATHVAASTVSDTEARQRATLRALAAGAGSPREVMLGLWEQVSAPETLPFVRLFFEIFGQAARGAPGTEELLRSLTAPWLDDGMAAAAQLGYDLDATTTRLGVAVARGLLLDLVAGTPEDEVDAAYHLFVDMFEDWASRHQPRTGGVDGQTRTGGVDGQTGADG